MFSEAENTRGIELEYAGIDTPKTGQQRKRG